MKSPTYLDYNATTPVDPRVFEAMLPYFCESFGNSVSASHSFGWAAEKAVSLAREQVADLLNCVPQEIFFTAGATESNNWVIRGLIDQLRSEDPKQQLSFISSSLEHSSIVSSMKAAESLYQAKVCWLDNDKSGIVSLTDLAAKIDQKTQLMSLMWINNEIGSINPMAELSAQAKTHQTYFHTDATQAIGKVKVDLKETAVDLLSFSAHKIYGPKGSGVLYIRSKNPKVQIKPLIYGGGHERGLRSGTLNVPAIVGLGAACTLVKQNLEKDLVTLRNLRDSFWAQIQHAFPKARLNGPALEDRAVNSLNISFLGYQVPPSFADIAVSRGSACNSGASAVSPVLRAIGLSESEADKTLRFSLGRHSNENDLVIAIEALKKALRPL